MGQFKTFLKRAIILTTILITTAWFVGDSIPIFKNIEFSFYPVMIIFMVAFSDITISFIE